MTKKEDGATEPKSADVRKQPEARTESRKKPAPWPFLTVGIVGVIVVLAFVSLAWLDSLTLRKTATTGPDRIESSELPRYESREPFNGYKERRDASRTMTYGVISEMSDDMITVIGGGKRIVVKLTDETRITGVDDADLAVNDTVSVTGTKNADGSVTAIRITVRNMAEPDDMPARERPHIRQAVPSA